MRKASRFVWVHPEDCDPPHGLDMGSPRDADKVRHLYECFVKEGFNMDEPALVGYPLDGRIQLLSGTHRHLAAKQAGILLPVTLWLRSDVEKMWGTDLWPTVIKDISVRNLISVEIKEGEMLIPYQAIDPKKMYEL